MLLLASGCAEPLPTTPAAPQPHVEHVAQTRHHGLTPGALPTARLATLEPGVGATRLGEDNPLATLTSPLVNAEVVEDGGEAVEEALSAFSKRKVDAYGAGLLTSIQLFGDPFHAPICEAPEIRVTLQDATGEDWEAALEVPQYAPFIGELEALSSTLSATCESGLLDAAGDVDAAVAAGNCSEEEQHQFFGEDCLTCLSANGGDFAACVDTGACIEEAPQVTWVLEGEEKAWYAIAQGIAWACRPDWLALAYVLYTPTDSGGMPRSFDHAGWNYYCFPLYDPATEAVTYACDAGDGPAAGHALADGMWGRTLWMEAEDGRRGHSLRQYYTPEVQLKSGVSVQYSWANSQNVGRLSKPIALADDDPGIGYASASWGLDPHALRPDGADTFARDWLALLALKTATTMDGVSITVANATRCTEWTELDGRAVCVTMGPPVEGWLNDALHYGATLADGQTYSYPLPVVTIASTGLPDPDVPGGIVPLIAGSDHLASPHWENCEWPNSFLPDRVRLPDQPWDHSGPASAWADGWRFGREDALDFRLVLSTNIARGYCP